MNRAIVCGVVSLVASGCARSNQVQPAPAPAAPSTAAPYILDIQEYDVNRNRTDLNGDGIPLVDIYSTLQIGIARESLAARAAHEVRTGATDSALVRLKALLDIARSGTSALLPLMRSYERAVTARTPLVAVEPQKEVVSSLGRRALQSARAVPGLSRAISAGLDRPLDSFGQLSVVFDTTAAFAARLASGRIDSLVSSQRVFVQLRAELRTPSGIRPVHLEGFDTLTPGPAYDPPRFAVTLTAEQLAEFKSYQAVASDIQHGDYAKALQSVVGTSPATIVTAVDQVTSCLTQVVGSAKDAALAPAPAQFQQARVSVEQYLASIASLRDRYAAPAPVATDALALVSGAAEDLQSLIDGSTTLRTSLATFSTEAQTAPTAMRPAANALVTQATACVDVLDKALAPVNALRERLRSAFGPIRIAADVDTIASRALRLPLNAVPASTQISLRTDVGQRAPGDELVIRVFAGAGDAAPISQLESRRLVIGHAVTYFQTTVGIIFARPTSSALPATSSEQRVSPFFPAAAYSVLLKPLTGRAARKSGWYSDVLDPGIGLNLSALDFDHDNNPELGLAGVLSIFRDYLQAGGGYDLQQDRGFWFLGVRLPAPTQGFPLSR